MSRFHLILASLTFHRRTNLPVALSVMAATAVLTGALLVGDSVRGTLAHLTLDRLGRIDEVLVTDRFFRAQLADELQTELAAAPALKDRYSAVLPAIFVQGNMENPQPPNQRRANRVTVLGVDAAFWRLGHGGPKRSPRENEIVLNAPLASDLTVKVGDDVLLRIGQVSQIPADSPLGHKMEIIRSRRLTVSEIVAADGLGRFAVRPSQQLSFDAFVATETLADILDQRGRVNAIFVAGTNPDAVPSPQESARLQQLLRPRLEDYGISIRQGKPGYVQFTSDRMLLDAAAVRTIEHTFADDRPQAVITYLANSISAGNHSIPYSTVTAIDFASDAPLGPFVTPEGKTISPLGPGEIALNRWAADDLDVKPGDEIEIAYFEPESTHGQIRERTATFRLKAIVALQGAAADPELTPPLSGVTDRLSIGDWDAPFPFDSSRIRKKDEAYWNKYRTTPKAFVALATGRRLWASRFGDTTSVRIAPPVETTTESLRERIAFDPQALGFVFLPVKRMGLTAASGSTSFDELFLGFSFFIIAAAVMLVALLYRLGMEQRAQEIGTLLALGLRRRDVGWLLAAEGLVVAAVGSLAGVAVGVGYAWLMLVGLRTWWLAAISTPFLRLYVSTTSLIVGYASGLLVSSLTILWTLRRTGHLSARRLLVGEATVDRWIARAASPWTARLGWVLVILAAIVGFFAMRLRGEAQAGSFFSAGALVLGGCLTLVWSQLHRRPDAALATGGRFALARLAIRNGTRNPLRSTLTIGLVAAASFLIVALSAFRLDPDREGTGRQSGAGGFALIAESDQPIYQDLNTPAGRDALGLDTRAGQRLARCSVVPLRVQPGDDASCLNLYQTSRPRVLGVPPAFIERGGFDWAETIATSEENKANPWLLLDALPSPGSIDPAQSVPVVLDANTATYGLHKKLGDTLEVADGRGQPLRLRIVALLKNSILQGDVLMSEQQFLRHFADVNGYRMFLIDAQPAEAAAVEHDLENALGDYGFDAEPTSRRLAEFFAVQNTYLSTFQSLGGLGLLLGTFGLAAVQMRSVLERRGELALMRAAGFRRAMLAQLVMIENGMLLVGGLATGVMASLVAVLPHLVGGGASLPWRSLVGTLLTVFVVGLATGMLVVRAALRADILPALRGE